MSLLRHTNRVAFLRRSLPLIAGVVLVAVIIWPMINEYKRNILNDSPLARAHIEKIELTTQQSTGNTQLQVTHPEFSGMDDEGRPYRVTADRVMQGLKIGAEMTLENPSARMTLDKEKNITATLKGETGVYDPTKKTLTLAKNVTMTHSDGYTLDMQDLFIDLTKGLSKTTTPVSGSGPLGQLEGESLELNDKGDHIILHGRSKVVLIPQKDK